jgi:transposase
MEPISNNSLPKLSPAKRHRRRHSPAFKARVLAACAEPGASVAAVARHFQLNANLIHKWRQAARDRGTDSPHTTEGFIPLPVVPAAEPDSDLHVTIILDGFTLRWPLSHINRALPWLQALQS